MKSQYFINIKSFAFLLCLHLLCSHKGFSQNTNNFWQFANNRNPNTNEIRHIIPQSYQTLSLNKQDFFSFMSQIPIGKPHQAQSPSAIISLPMADGSFQQFSITETPLLSEDFALLRPEIHTYTAQGIDDQTAVAYLDWTMQGFHGMILSANGTTFIDPYSKNNTDFYICYRKEDYINADKINNKTCTTFTDSHWIAYEKERDKRLNKPFGLKEKDYLRPSGTQLRTYRLAVASTVEYTAFHGNTVASTQNAITTTINRVRGVYEREVGISFTLINNTNIIFVGQDEFDNSEAPLLINQSQTVIDNSVGASNYDIGHTVSTGGGGLAGLGVVCRDGQKARGITGSSSPIGDPYDIDYVAHEIGHQFGGQHTFNGNQGSCSGNRSASSAYEVDRKSVV